MSDTKDAWYGIGWIRHSAKAFKERGMPDDEKTLNSYADAMEKILHKCTNLELKDRNKNREEFTKLNDIIIDKSAE